MVDSSQSSRTWFRWFVPYDIVKGINTECINKIKGCHAGTSNGN